MHEIWVWSSESRAWPRDITWRHQGWDSGMDSVDTRFQSWSIPARKPAWLDSQMDRGYAVFLNKHNGVYYEHTLSNQVHIWPLHQSKVICTQLSLWLTCGTCQHLWCWWRIVSADGPPHQREEVHNCYTSTCQHKKPTISNFHVAPETRLTTENSSKSGEEATSPGNCFLSLGSDYGRTTIFYPLISLHCHSALHSLPSHKELMSPQTEGSGALVCGVSWHCTDLATQK